MSREVVRASAWAIAFTLALAILIVLGSRNLAHFDAALVGYTFATLFATFGITYRYAMWLSRPPTRMYWRRGWSLFLTRSFGSNIAEACRRVILAFAANRFIFRRSRLRGLFRLFSLARGCLIARFSGFGEMKSALRGLAQARRIRCVRRGHVVC